MVKIILKILSGSSSINHRRQGFCDVAVGFLFSANSCLVLRLVKNVNS